MNRIGVSAATTGSPDLAVGSATDRRVRHARRARTNPAAERSSSAGLAWLSALVLAEVPEMLTW
jgi:hypothetical protein